MFPTYGHLHEGHFLYVDPYAIWLLQVSVTGPRGVIASNMYSRKFTVVNSWFYGPNEGPYGSYPKQLRQEDDNLEWFLDGPSRTWSLYVFICSYERGLYPLRILQTWFQVVQISLLGSYMGYDCSMGSRILDWTFWIFVEACCTCMFLKLYLLCA